MVLVVVASRLDQFARELVARWTPHGAALLTCTDLCLKGWRYYLDSVEDAAIVIDQHIMTAKNITGVLTRLPSVFEHELVEIVSADRTYVAAEMTAFLLSWLSALKCPVLNRPTSTCLSGPYWRQEQWISAAARIGIPVRPFHRSTRLSVDAAAEGSTPDTITLTVVGQQCLGTTNRTLVSQALRLAEAAHVDLLEVCFGDPETEAYFLCANPWPDFTNVKVEESILAYLQAGKRTSEI